MPKKPTYEELEQRVRELEASKTLREQSSIDGLIESKQTGVGVQGIVRDISKRKLIEEELKTSEQKYRNIAESMPGMILKYKLNPDGSDQLLYISKGVEDLYEIQREDAVKNNTLLWDRVHRDDLEEFTASVKKSAETLSFWKLEHRLKMPDGRVKWVQARGVPNKQEDGSVVWDSLAVDITDRKQAEQALKASEERLRTLVDTSPFPIVVTDVEHDKVLYWSKSAQELFGHQPKTAAEWFSLAYPDPQYRQEVIDRSKPYLEQVKHSKTAVNLGEYQIVCRDGSVKICEIYAQFIPGHLVLINNDITERKKTEEALKSNYALLQIAGKTAIFGGWSVDLEKNICTWSDAVADIHDMPHGYAPPVHEAINFYAPEWREKITQIFSSCAKEGSSGLSVLFK